MWQGLTDEMKDTLKRMGAGVCKGRKLTPDGYVVVLMPQHPYCRKSDGYIYEHRVVKEATLGRFLKPGEVIHHADRDKLNNHPHNLVIFKSHGVHIRYHAILRRLAKVKQQSA